MLAADISGRQEETAAELGDAVVPFQCDVTKEDQVEAMFAAALDAFGRIDAVLNVAGIGSAGALADVAMDEYDRIMDADLRSVMLGTKTRHQNDAADRWWRDPKLVIDRWHERHTLSCERVLGRQGRCHRAHQVEYGTQGIRAVSICPGFIETEMSGGPGAAARFPQLVQGTALKRGGQPQEVAELFQPSELYHRGSHPG